jgi:hypothetical protein
MAAPDFYFTESVCFCKAVFYKICHFCKIARCWVAGGLWIQAGVLDSPPQRQPTKNYSEFRLKRFFEIQVYIGEVTMTNKKFVIPMIIAISKIQAKL